MFNIATHPRSKDGYEAVQRWSCGAIWKMADWLDACDEVQRKEDEKRKG